MSNSETPTSNGIRTVSEKLSASGIETVENPDHDRIVEYRCPFCQYAAPSERVVRAHITEASVGNHENRHGYLDNLYVQGLDAEGEVVGDVHTNYADEDRMNVEVSNEMLPKEATDKQLMILEVCVRSPGKTNVAVVELLSEAYDYDTSESYVSKVRRRFLGAITKDDLEQARGTDDDSEDDEDGPSPPPAKTIEERTYDDLTDNQTRIVDTVASYEFDDPADPDTWELTQTEIAEEANVSLGSVRPTVEKYGEIIEARATVADSAAESVEMPDVVEDDEEPEPEPEPEPETDDSDYIRVEKATMRAFAREVDALTQTAESQREAAPRDSSMKAHADGKIEVAGRTRQFLEEIAEENK